MESNKASHWWMKLSGSLNVLLALAVLGVVGIAAFYGHKMYQKQSEMQVTQEMVLSNLRIVNEQQVVSDIIHEKLGDKLTTDQIAKMAFVIIDGCRRNDIDPGLIMGLIEKESTWNPKALSPMGAIGLMQCMPDTAIRHFKQRGLTFSIDALYDPVLNVSIGIDILSDKQETAIAQGKATKGDFVQALYYYVGKDESYARGVINLSVAYRKRLDAPVRELIKRANDQDKLQAIAKEAVATKEAAKVAKK